MTRDDHGPHARRELRDWPMETLRYELAHQQAEGVHTRGTGRCGHPARGSGFCAACLQAEIDRRHPDTLPGGGFSKSTVKRHKALSASHSVRAIIARTHNLTSR